MIADLLTLPIQDESHVVLARRRARDIAGMVGFEQRDCVRIATTVSGIVRNAWRYAGGGRVEFRLVRDGENDVLDIAISDNGPGIPNLTEILGGRHRFATGMGVGLLAGRSLMERFEVDTSDKGTVVHLGKIIPRCFIDPIPVVATRVTEALLRFRSPDATTEAEEQERELLQILSALDKSEAQLAQANEELEETYRGVISLYQELDDRAQEIQKVVDLKTRFLSNITHEFRTPLNSIIGLSRMLIERTDGDLTVEQEKQTRFINHAARDLYDLVNDLLDLAKADACKIEITPGPVSVSEMFASLRGMFRPLIDNHAAVNLVFETPTPPVTMVSDERKLSQILRNLVSNALKYTISGEVRVSTRMEQGRIVFCVKDTGIGIPEEHQDKIFEEFYQVQNPLQQKTKGTGLGLSLSRRLADLLGGDISFESTPGVGTTFWVDLPLVFATEEAAPAAPKAKGPNLVLFVDHRVETLVGYERMLERTAFKALLAHNVQEAFNILKRVSVSAIVTSSNEAIRILATGLPASRVPIPAFVLVGDVPEDDDACDLVDAILPAPVEAGQLITTLDHLPVWVRPTALIVDHSPDARDALRKTLEDFQLDVIEAANAEEAMVLVKNRRPTVVFTETVFPDGEGIEVIERFHGVITDGSLVIHSSQVFNEAERDYYKRYAAALIRKGPSADPVYRTALIHEIVRARRRLLHA